MTRHMYVPHVHDPILSDLNQKWRRTDQEIADEMGFDKQTITKHRTRLGLPRYVRPVFVKQGSFEQSPAAPKDRPNPVAVAQYTLGNRLVERPAGYFLDRVPVGLDAIMKETNRVRSRAGLPQVGVERWRV